MAYPGSNVDEFISRVKLNRIYDIKNSAAVIIHVGTNNLESDPETMIVQKVLELARLIYGKYHCPVLISLIIPRLDSPTLNVKATKTNDLIKKGIHHAFMHCLYTYHLFAKKGSIKSDLYCQLDKIHPNIKGNKLLFKYMAIRVNELKKALGIPRGEQPPPKKQVIRRSDDRW